MSANAALKHRQLLHGVGALIDRLGDRITGDQLGGVKLTPPVDESLSELGRRTAAIGRQFIAANKGTVSANALSITVQQPETQPAELFQITDLMQYWNHDWKLLRAGVRGGRRRHARDSRQYASGRRHPRDLSA
jgi:hypothetical protein